MEEPHSGGDQVSVFCRLSLLLRQSPQQSAAQHCICLGSACPQRMHNLSKQPESYHWLSSQEKKKKISCLQHLDCAHYLMPSQWALPRWVWLPFLHSLPPAIYTDRSLLHTNQPYLSASPCYRPFLPCAALEECACAFPAGDHRIGPSTQICLTNAEVKDPFPFLLASLLLMQSWPPMPQSHLLMVSSFSAQVPSAFSTEGLPTGSSPACTASWGACRSRTLHFLWLHEIALCSFLQLTKFVLMAAQLFIASVISLHFLPSVNLLREHPVPLSRSFIKILNITADWPLVRLCITDHHSPDPTVLSVFNPSHCTLNLHFANWLYKWYSPAAVNLKTFSFTTHQQIKAGGLLYFSKRRTHPYSNQDKHAPTFRTGKDNWAILKVHIEVTSLNQTVLTKLKTPQITDLVLPTAPHLLNVRYTWIVNRCRRFWWTFIWIKLQEIEEYSNVRDSIY